jgi:hypothetical protein
MRSITKILILVILAVLIVWLTRWDYKLPSSTFLAIYRINRITGTVEISIAGKPWQKIQDQQPPKTNEWGDIEVQK